MQDDKKTRVVTIRLTDAVHASLVAMAKADRRKVATFVAMVLEDYVAEKQKPPARASRKP